MSYTFSDGNVAFVCQLTVRKGVLKFGVSGLKTAVCKQLFGRGGTGGHNAFKTPNRFSRLSRPRLVERLLGEGRDDAETRPSVLQTNIRIVPPLQSIYWLTPNPVAPVPILARDRDHLGWNLAGIGG